MLFTSLTFVAFFTIVYGAYLAARHYGSLAIQNLVLAVASLIFYGWWDYRYTSLLLFSCGINYLAALKIDQSATQSSRRAWLAIGVTIQLLILGVFKYLPFTIQNINACLAFLGAQARLPLVELTLPVGISFYTFQAIGYTIDVYRRASPVCRSVVDFTLFVSFFPQLVAGPIETSRNLLAQVERPREITPDRLRRGLYWVLIGLYQKVVIADTLAPMVEYGFDHVDRVSGISSLLALIAFSLQIYGDFAGYTSIARGLGEWMGFSFIANFRRPYLADSPREFWRRWHISLSQWLRDYLYISLGGNRKGPGANGVVELSPFEFLDRLADLVPPPRKHRHRYHGVFAPNHKLRPAVTALAIGNIGKRREAVTGGHAAGLRATGGCCDANTNQKPRSHDTSRIAWAKLMARVGEEFPLACPTCGGDIRLIAFITESGPIRKILTHLGEPLEPPPVSPARGPPTDWGELVQIHDDRDVFQASPDELPAIDIHNRL